MPRTSSLVLSALVLAAGAAAQSQTLLFTGRFPFVSLDAPNERAGGSITRLEEFDFSYVTPGAGAVARTLLPASAMHCYFGDANNDGDYTKLFAFKTYFTNIQIGGLFVKHADRAAVEASKVYFTVRDDVATHAFEVFTTNGTQVRTLRPGDWVRFLPNGNTEFFLDADQLDVAAGPPPAGQASIKGAHALLQTAAGDLYYVPVQGGQWVNGNFGGPVFANDGAICKIDAAAITYDSRGNVTAIAPNSARLVIEESSVGTNQPPTSTRVMAVNSGAMDRNGVAIVAAGVYGKTCGLALDPNGGSFASTFQDVGGNYTQEPNLLFCSDAGGYAGTIFSTANNGSVAVINGVQCGSTQLGVPANGSWLGVQLDVPNFQPSLMSLQLVGGLAGEPAVLDMPNSGALQNASAQPLWEVDLHAESNSVAFLLASFGPSAPGGFVPSFPLTAFPPIFAPGSHPDVFVGAGTQTVGLAIANTNGYATWSFANPNNGSFTGLTVLLQAAATSGGTQLKASTPVLMQLK